MTDLTTPAVETRVLLVDDDAKFLDRARFALEPVASLRMAGTGRAALATVQLWRPDIVLFDLLMGDLDGFSFLEAISRNQREWQPFVLYTTDGRGADTRVRPLPNWRVGTLVRSCSAHQIRVAVLQAARCQDPPVQRWVTA